LQGLLAAASIRARSAGLLRVTTVAIQRRI